MNEENMLGGPRPDVPVLDGPVLDGPVLAGPVLGEPVLDEVSGRSRTSRTAVR